MTTPRAALRAATDAAHQRLHRLPDFAALAAGRLDAPGYTALLARLLGFQEPAEAAIAAQLGDAAYGLDIRALRRAALLRADLAALGAGPGTATTDVLLAPPPALASPAMAMGALYVIEGATLGGQVLAGGLDALLGPGMARGRRFLLAGRDPARPGWRDVGAAIDRCGAQPGALAAMIHGAAATFDAFAGWFARDLAR